MVPKRLVAKLKPMGVFDSLFALVLRPIFYSYF